MSRTPGVPPSPIGPTNVPVEPSGKVLTMLIPVISSVPVFSNTMVYPKVCPISFTEAGPLVCDTLTV